MEIEIHFPAGRAFIRPSGTEPVIRVMVECADKEHAQKLVNALKELVIKYPDLWL